MRGSRIKEVRMNLPTILEAAGQLGPEYECLLPVAPTLDRSFLQDLINRHSVTLVPESSPPGGIRTPASLPAPPRQVEAAMMQTPFVMVYCFSSYLFAGESFV
jgi:lipid-A-disaccharide synthase